MNKESLPDVPGEERESGSLRNKFKDFKEDETTFLPKAPPEGDLSGKVSAPMVGHTDLESLMQQLSQEEENTPPEVLSDEAPAQEIPSEEGNAAPVSEDTEAPAGEEIPAEEEIPSGEPPVNPDATRIVPDLHEPFRPEVRQEDFHVDFDPPLSEEEQIERSYRSVAGEPPAAGGGKNKKVLLLSLCGAFLVVLLAVIGFFLMASSSDPYGGQILNNVTVAEVNLGGLTRKEAEAVLSSITDHTFSRQDMVVEFPQATLVLKPQDTNVHLDVKSAVKAAYSYGRTGNKEQRRQDYEASLTGNHIVSLLPHLRMDEKFIRSQLADYAETISAAYTPSSYALEGIRPELHVDHFDPDIPCQTLMLTLGTQGATMDQEQVFDRILDGYGMNQFHIRITDMEVTQSPEPLDLQKIYEETYIEPVDSAMDMQNFQVVPGSYGYGFDLEKAEKLLRKADYGDTVTVPMEYIEPEILSDEVFFQDVLGESVTEHGDNPSRNANLKLACETLNGMVLYPGDSFSFNEALGKRTADKGYKPAPAYSGSQLVNSLGGGICQVSTTLYNACLLSDLEILERTSHGFPASYVEKGLDATVSWDGPDFKFRNNTNFPIKIEAEADDKVVHFRILGTDEKSYYVKMETEITGYTESKVIYEKHAPGGSYRDGQTIRYGSDGYIVKSYRCKYDKETNELISRDYEATSSYMKMDTIIASVEDPEPTEPEPTEPKPTKPKEPKPTRPKDPEPTTPPTTEEPPAPPEPPETAPAQVPESTGSGSSEPDDSDE